MIQNVLSLVAQLQEEQAKQSNRDRAVAITKLEEAALWLAKGDLFRQIQG